jgi:hypothetical protein
MADQAVDAGDVFFYTGGRAPQHVINVIIDKSVKEIDDEAFFNNPNLRSVEFHDGVERIGKWAFCECPLLSQIKLSGVKLIEQGAFSNCRGLEDVDFGDKLVTIGVRVLFNCTSLRSITMPSVRAIGEGAFGNCTVLTDAEFGKELEELGVDAFERCSSLRRISIPLKDNMFIFSEYVQGYNQFECCPALTTVDLVGGGIHKTITSLHLESWRNEMNEQIDRVNRFLPNTHWTAKADEIRYWIKSVIRKIEHYKAEHNLVLKEATALLELALWKANISWTEGANEEAEVRITRGKAKRARREKQITSGASIVIKNVLPFLELA